MSDANLLPYKHGYYLWKYVPSLPGAIIFAVLFASITGAHIWRLFKTRLWFCIPFTIGGLLEIMGYGSRCAAHFHTDHLLPYAIQSLTLLLPPALFAASIYMVLGRIIRAVSGEAYSFVPVRRLTATFVLGDVLSFTVQGGAAGLMVSGSDLVLGQWIIVGGLLIQVVMFGLFGVTAVLFQHRYEKHSVRVAASCGGPAGWRESLYMLYGVSALIMVRSIFRVVEYALGQDGYPLQHEWTLYVFDSIPMFAVMVIFFYWYPSKIHKGRVIGTADSIASETVLELSPPARGQKEIHNS